MVIVVGILSLHHGTDLYLIDAELVHPVLVASLHFSHVHDVLRLPYIPSGSLRQIVLMVALISFN